MDSSSVQKESFDTKGPLHKIAERAMEYSINLDDRVDRSDALILRGELATVYLGNLRPGGMAVAIKTPRSNRFGDEGNIERILREILLRSRLNHPNVLSLLGITTNFNETLSIVSRWMERGNAHDYVKDTTIDPRPLIKGIAQGLQYLHNHIPSAVLHGDLKGLNVLISDDGGALLTNFTLSWFADSSPSFRDTGGTVNWMAPEIFDGGGPTAEGDVWAFGMTALELFTRKNPFHDCVGASAILGSIMAGSLNRPNDEDTYHRMSDAWWNILAKCWNHEPSSRPTISYVMKNIAALEIGGRDLPSSENALSSADPRRALEELIKRASQHFPEINLDGQVSRDDRYLLRGGCANIFRGTLGTSSTKVAIKTARGVPPVEEINRTLKEVYIWYKLRHSNVLPLLGITTQFDLTVSIVSRWMDNGNAHNYVRDATVDPRPLIKGAAEGLSYLHNHTSKIIHGDVKGFNVLISDDGRALLTDFGFSRLENSSFSMASYTHGGVRGTIRWMAPEVLDGKDSKELMADTDVWSFGMTALELFTRDVPFVGLSKVGAIMARILRGPPDRPSEEDTCHRLTDEWWDVCSACCNPEPSLRPTMSRIVDMITAIATCSLDSLTRTRANDASKITESFKSIEVADKPVASGLLTSPCAIAMTQTETEGTTKTENPTAQENTQPSTMDTPGRLQRANGATTSLGSSHVKGSSTAGVNPQPSTLNAPGRMPGASATLNTIDPPTEVQETVNTVTIFTCQEKPLQTPVELVLTLLPEGHSKQSGVFSPVIWRALQFPVGWGQKYDIDIPVSIGVSTRDELDGAVYCDISTIARGKAVYTFRRTKSWEQRDAEDYTVDSLGIANHSGIPKAFAMSAATAEGEHVPLLDIGYIQSGNMVQLERPVVLQAYAPNKPMKVGTLLPLDMKASALFSNDGIDTRMSHNNFRLRTDDGRYFLEPV